MRGLVGEPSPPSPAPRAIDDSVAEVLDDRLLPDAPWPVAVALSGGGDSTALLVAAKAWADRTGRRLIALTVDHRIQAASADWTQVCASLARRLGVKFEALSWEEPKPSSGLAAAARDARHRLLAQAARRAGAKVILIGHTADDLDEAAAMRAEGSTTPSPRPWTPSPVWPEGRGLFLLRPLLSIRRKALRQWLVARGETWIEDPANEDPNSPRARARAAGLKLDQAPLTPPDVRRLALVCQELDGALAMPRDMLREAGNAEAARLVSIACLCASGQARPPRGERLGRLMAAVRGRVGLNATLAGARIEADADSVRFMREAGRTGVAQAILPRGEAFVWDGRFEIRSEREGLAVGPLAGFGKRLRRADEEALRRVPPRARGTLPAIRDGETVWCPTLNPVEGVDVLALAGARLAAASGLVDREPD